MGLSSGWAFVAAAALGALLGGCGGGGGGGSGTSAPTGLAYSDSAPVYGLCGEIVPNVPTTTGGDPTEYSVQPPLPSGLVLDPASGVISGAPTAVLPPTSFRIRASNSEGGAATVLVIAVEISNPAGLGYGPVGATFGVGLDTVRPPVLASGVANQWVHVSGALPPGITFDPSTGALSGYPLTIPSPASSTVTIRASNTCTGVSTTSDVFVEIRPPWPRAAYVVHEAEPVLATYLPERASGLLRPNGWVEAADTTPAEVACSPDGRWLFVAEGDTTSVRTYELSQLDGRPKETAHSVSTGALPPSDLAVHPTSRYLYAITAEKVVAQFSVGPAGELDPTPGPVPPTGEDPSDLIVDPLGRFAWVTNSAEATISCYSVDPGDGALTHVDDVATGAAPLGAAVTRDGAWVYVACLDDSSISIFAVQSSGALAPAGARATSAGHSPVSLAVHPSAPYLYAAHGFDAVVEQFAISSGSGALSPLSPASIALAEPAVRIDCDPEGGLVYVQSQRYGWSVYAPAPDGRLLDTPVSAIAGRGNTRAIAFQPGRAPSETYADAVYASGSDGQVFQYDVGLDGSLAPFSPPSVSGAGENTRWVEAHPWLDVLYAASENPSGDEALSRFDISNGGELAWVSSSGTHSGGRSVQLDPSGRYAYQVLDGAPGRIRAFRVADDGSLKATSSTDISAGPRAIAFHPGGRFAYVPCFDDDVIDVLEIDWASGALVPLTSILTGDGPLQIAIPSSGTHVLSLESSTSTVVVYRVRPVDGSLEFLPGGFNDLGSGVSAIEVDPTAEHMFASGVSGSITRAYRLDAQTGALFSTGHEIASAPALALRIAPNARDLYATLPGGVIQRYEFDSGAGLTPRESLPAGASPAGLALRIRVR